MMVLVWLRSVLNVLALSIGYMVRLGSGAFMAEGLDKCARPSSATQLQLYDAEFDRECRAVRETLSVLDLDVRILPCPRARKTDGEGSSESSSSLQGSRFRGELSKLGEAAGRGRNVEPPVLVDKGQGNSGKQFVLFGSKEICEHLWERYGAEARAPWNHAVMQNPVLFWTHWIVSAVRPFDRQGWVRRPARRPQHDMVLWGSEGSPFVARVREALCVLEIPYTYKMAPKFKSVKRREWMQKYGNRLSSARKASGLIQIPLLEDPNEGSNLLESKIIVEYLFRKYAT